MFSHVVYHLKEAVAALINMEDPHLKLDGYYINPLLPQGEPAAFVLFHYDMPATDFKGFMILLDATMNETKHKWTCYTKSKCKFSRTADAVLGFGQLDFVMMHVRVQNQELLSPGPIPVMVELQVEWDETGPSSSEPLPWSTCKLPSNVPRNDELLLDDDLDQMLQARWHKADDSCFPPQIGS